MSMYWQCERDVDREDSKLTEALLSEKVKEFILAEYGGSVVPAF